VVECISAGDKKRGRVCRNRRARAIFERKARHARHDPISQSPKGRNYEISKKEGALARIRSALCRRGGKESKGRIIKRHLRGERDMRELRIDASRVWTNGPTCQIFRLGLAKRKADAENDKRGAVIKSIPGGPAQPT